MENITYTQAVERLEEIMSLIQGGGMDVDKLAVALKEASALVQFCRSKLYKVDEDDDKSANHMYLLSQVIKLGTIAFKQAYRLVVRGYFNTMSNIIGCYVFGSYDGRQWALLGRNEKNGRFTDIGCNISHTDVKFLRLCLAGQLSKDSRIDFVEVAAEGSMLNNKVR